MGEEERDEMETEEVKARQMGDASEYGSSSAGTPSVQASAVVVSGGSTPLHSDGTPSPPHVALKLTVPGGMAEPPALPPCLPHNASITNGVREACVPGEETAGDGLAAAVARAATARPAEDSARLPTEAEMRRHLDAPELPRRADLSIQMRSCSRPMLRRALAERGGTQAQIMQDRQGLVDLLMPLLAVERKAMLKRPATAAEVQWYEARVPGAAEPLPRGDDGYVVAPRCTAPQLRAELARRGQRCEVVLGRSQDCRRLLQQLVVAEVRAGGGGHWEGDKGGDGDKEGDDGDGGDCGGDGGGGGGSGDGGGGGGGGDGDGGEPMGPPELFCPAVGHDCGMGSRCTLQVPRRSCGRADVKSSFRSLAAHMSRETRTHHTTDVDPQDALDAGVWQCPVPGCRMWQSTVGFQSSMAGHLSNGDDNHRTALREEEGGRGGWIRRLQQQASKGSPAHYYNTVHYRDNSSREALLRGRQRYQEEVARAAEQRRWLEARRLEVEGGSNDEETDQQPRIDGATAREWGLRPRAADGEIDSPGSLYEWAWLDDLDEALLAAIGVIPARMCELSHKREYLRMLDCGFAYAARHSATPNCVRGFKFVLLAKLVTTGIETGPRRDGTVQLGLMRMVMAGHLQQLVEDMLTRVGKATAEEVENAVREAAEREEQVRLATALDAKLNAAEVAAALAQEARAEGEQAAARTAGAADAPGGKAQASPQAAQARLLHRVLRLVNAGYLSKGYAQLSASPVVDTRRVEFRQLLRSKHPQSEAEGVSPLTLEDMQDEPGVTPLVTTREAFNYIFARPPMARAMAVDGVSYEELGALYHGGERFRTNLFLLVSRINSGSLHPAAADFLGDLHLLGLDKPGAKVDVRPIGIPAALRRMANRVLMYQESKKMGEVFTETKVPPELLVAAGFAADTPCNVPLQLGVGLPGGAEIIIGAARAHLARHPRHAVCSDDKGNGFNRISRKAIFAGLRRWFPNLIPAVRLWYRQPRRLLVRGEHGWETAVDENGDMYYSAEGCAQGDALGPFLWSIGYHWALLRMQAAHPTSLIMAYLDDNYAFDEPLEAYACMLTGSRVTEEEAGVASNMDKQEVYSPEADLADLPATLRGAAGAPPNESNGYGGGRLPCIRVLGAYLGDEDACSAALVRRVEAHLQPLFKVLGLRDVGRTNTSLQVQLCILRYCANTQLTYFLRTMPPSVTIDAARRHDEIIEEVWHGIVQTAAATVRERELAFRQARLPVKLGGMGITSMEQVRPAAWVGSWALTWPTLRRLHAPFGSMNITAPTAGSDFAELQQCHGDLLARH